MENLIQALKLQLEAVKLLKEAAWNNYKAQEQEWSKHISVYNALETTIKHLESQLPTPPTEPSAAVMP